MHLDRVVRLFVQNVPAVSLYASTEWPKDPQGHYLLNYDTYEVWAAVQSPGIDVEMELEGERLYASKYYVVRWDDRIIAAFRRARDMFMADASNILWKVTSVDDELEAMGRRRRFMQLSTIYIRDYGDLFPGGDRTFVEAEGVTILPP